MFYEDHIVRFRQGTSAEVSRGNQSTSGSDLDKSAQAITSDIRNVLVTEDGILAQVVEVTAYQNDWKVVRSWTGAVHSA